MGALQFHARGSWKTEGLYRRSIIISKKSNNNNTKTITTPIAAPQGLTPKDPMWIGCWWLGFLIFGFLLFFPSVALYFFPSDSISAKKEDVSKKRKFSHCIFVLREIPAAPVIASGDSKMKDFGKFARFQPSDQI